MAVMATQGKGLSDVGIMAEVALLAASNSKNFNRIIPSPVVIGRGLTSSDDVAQDHELRSAEVHAPNPFSSRDELQPLYHPITAKKQMMFLLEAKGTYPGATDQEVEVYATRLARIIGSTRIPSCPT